MSDEASAKTTSAGEWLDDLTDGYTAYFLTSLPVLLGVWFSVAFMNRGGPPMDPVAACVRFDATHYIDIIRHGHSYDPTERSLVAQFPAYPLVARWLCRATGLEADEGALLTANLFLVGAFVLLARWVRFRWPEATTDQRMFVLAIFGLWPMGLFFRMPYAESLFLCGTLAVLYGMARGWPLIVLALLAGFVTAVRPFGVAVTAAFVAHVLAQPGRRPWTKAARAAALTPLACWGLLAYMAYQQMAFGTPWGFVQTQQHWTLAAPEDRSWQAKALSLLSMEPIWGVYEPSSRRYWENVRTPGSPLFNIMFWNPILFLLAAILLVLGRWKRWLTGSELILGTCLLAIPYLTRAYEMSMGSHGRFAALVVVNYLVIGHILARSGTRLRIALCAGFATVLCLFTSLYAANYLIF
jgi:hypothetical protein